LRSVKTIARNPKATQAVEQDPLKTSRHLLSLVQSSLEDDKAEDAVVIELAGKSSIADYMVIATGRSQRQVGAMTDHIMQKLKAEGVRSISTEGMERCDWVLIDSGDILIHLFRPEVRSFYNLEKMWGLDLQTADHQPTDPVMASVTA